MSCLIKVPVPCLFFSGLQYGVIYASQPYGLGLDETIMPQYLKQLGYATHGVGKVCPSKNSFCGFVCVLN